MANDALIKKFNGPLDFLEWATNAPKVWKDGYYASRETGNEGWAGTKNYDEAYKLAKYGWPEGLKLLSKQVMLANVALAERQAAGRKKRYDFAGAYPNPPRAAAGEMMSMVLPLRPKMLEEGKLVKIRYDIGRASSVDVDTIMRLGGALCSYISMLERDGYVVQLDAFSEMRPSTGYGNVPDVSFSFPLKRAGTPLAMVDLVFWIAHPSALRRVEFSAMERLDIERGYKEGYGRPARVTDLPPDTLYLRIDDAGHTVKKCLENIRAKHLALLGPQSLLAPKLKSLEFV